MSLFLLTFFCLSSYMSAEFQSEWKECQISKNISSCYDKLQQKYSISKSTACSMNNDIVVKKPLQAKRLNEKVYTYEFYKYNNKLFYQIAVSKNKKITADSIKSYMYMYDCKIKKAFDMSKNFPISALSLWIEDYISNEEKKDLYLFDFLQFKQNNKGIVFIQHNLSRWIPNSNYYLLDTVKYLLTPLNISKFKNYDQRIANVIDLSIAQGWPTIYIENVNKNFIGDIFIDDSVKSKIDFLSKTISIK